MKIFSKNSTFIPFGFNRISLKNSFLKFPSKNVFTYPCPRKLNELVKISLFEKEQPSKIKEIWSKYFIEKERVLGENMTGGEMNLILKNATANPFFIFPIKRNEGHFILLSQNQEKSFLFTFLSEFNKNPEEAAPFFVLTFYDELIFKKGLGLIRGDIVGDLTNKESEILIRMLRDFYSKEDFFEDIITFNRQPEIFDHEKHIKKCLEYFV